MMRCLLLLLLIAGAANACEPSSISVTGAPRAAGYQTSPGCYARDFDFYVLCNADTIYTRFEIMRFCGPVGQANAALIARAVQFKQDLHRAWARRYLFADEIGEDMRRLLGDQFLGCYDDFTTMLRALWVEQDSTATLAQAESILAIALAPLPTTPNQYMLRYANYRGITAAALLDSILADILYIE